MKMEKFAYIGCRTTKERKARGKGISVYTRLMEITGSWYRSWKVR